MIFLYCAQTLYINVHTALRGVLFSITCEFRNSHSFVLYASLVTIMSKLVNRHMTSMEIKISNVIS